MSNTSHPEILPETPAPAMVHDCHKCELSKQRSRVIWGEGNPMAPVFVILDNPGAREDKNSQPFLCGTRETLLRTAIEAGVRSDQLYVSYVLKCRPICAYDKPKARQICMNYLWEQLQSNPTVIMTLGDVAAQCLFRDPTLSVKDLRGTVHKIQNQSVVVSYHPLAVRRRPVLNKYFLDDWKIVHSILDLKFK